MAKWWERAGQALGVLSRPELPPLSVPVSAPPPARGGSHYRADDLVNALTGMGSAQKDKRLAVVYEAEAITQQQLEEWYRGSDLASTIVELVPEEMFRRGFELSIGDESEEEGSGASEDVVADTVAFLDESGFLDTLQQGFCYQRAYGGAGILLGADDGKDLAEELDEEAVRTFEWMTLLSPSELRPKTYVEDVKDRRYGEVETYEYRARRSLNPGAPLPAPVTVHHSRVIRLDGIRVSKHQRRNAEANGWGDSILVRCYPIIRDYTASWQGAATMLQNFAMTWMKLKGLSEIIEEEKSGRAIIQRATAAQLSRSVASMVVMDTEEEVGILTTPLSGYPDMMREFAVRLAAAVRMPVTLLMGQSPAGLNATGESDVRNWYAHVARLQEKALRPVLNRVLQLLFRSADGPTSGKEPERWEVKFRPLWELTELQQAELMGKAAQADAAYISSGVLTPEEVAISRFGSGKFSLDTTIDVDGRRAIADEGYEAAKEEVAAQEEAAAEAQASAALEADVVEDGLRQDYSPDQPRDEQGRFGEGGGGSSPNGGASVTQLQPARSLFPGKAERRALAKEGQKALERAHGKKLPDMSLLEVADAFRASFKASSHTANDPTYLALAAELKRRGIGSFDTLEQKLATARA